jgi:hypothetical protein
VRAPLVIAACALALAAPRPAGAQLAPPTVAPSGLVLGASMAGGVELGLSSGKAGQLELEVLGGWELGELPVRAELGLALGVAPDTSVSARPGLRAPLPGTPIWLRASADWSSSRAGPARWRWLLLGAAWELRVTGVVGFSLEADLGLPLASTAGVPVLLRAAVTFRP